MTVPLKLNILGRFETRLPSGEVVSLPTRKTETLLAYLALVPGPHSRDHLSNLLWGDRSDQQARNSLRQALNALKKLFDNIEPLPLQIEHTNVNLANQSIEIDAVKLEELVEEQTPQAAALAIKLYRGEFLEGVVVRDSNGEEWLASERDRFRRLSTNALENVLVFQLETGELDKAVEYGERLISLDSLNESAWRKLMQVYAARGDRNHALMAYKRCCDVLNKELGVEPSHETTKLQTAIREGSVDVRAIGAEPEPIITSEPIHAVTTGLPVPSKSVEKPSIAILPFLNISGNPEEEYFSDGITEDIITEFSRFSLLNVVARHSSFAFKGDKVDIKEVAEKLGVQYIVEGSVRRAGNRIRITAQLIDAETGKHIWGERYDREPDDIFTVQDEVTRTIVATITAQLGKTVSENAARKPTTSIKSYEYLLQANRQYYRFNPDDNIAAARLYQKAIERDPQFARAYAGLANTYTTDHFLGWLRTKNALQNGLEYAQKALEFDSNDALARTILAWALIGNGRWEEAELELDRVMTLRSGDADVLAETGNGFKAVGRLEVGIALLEEATRLNPLFPDLYQRWLGQAYYRARRYQEAATTLRAVRVDGWGYGWLAASFARLDELERARETLNKFIAQRQKELKSSGVSASTTADLLGNYKDNFRTEADWKHLLDGLHMAGLNK